MTDNNNLEQQYQDVDEKALLIQQVALLQSIDRKLAILLDAETNATERNTDASETETVTCTSCNTEIPTTERKAHARECFKWSPELGTGALDTRFE